MKDSSEQLVNFGIVLDKYESDRTFRRGVNKAIMMQNIVAVLQGIVGIACIALIIASAVTGLVPVLVLASLSAAICSGLGCLSIVPMEMEMNLAGRLVAERRKDGQRIPNFGKSVGCFLKSLGSLQRDVYEKHCKEEPLLLHVHEFGQALNSSGLEHKTGLCKSCADCVCPGIEEDELKRVMADLREDSDAPSPPRNLARRY